MNTSKYPMYGAAALVGGAIALWAGVPAYFLLVLICPVMMFFMMASMSGASGRSKDAHTQDASSETKTPHA